MVAWSERQLRRKEALINVCKYLHLIQLFVVIPFLLVPLALSCGEDSAPESQLSPILQTRVAQRAIATATPVLHSDRILGMANEITGEDGPGIVREDMEAACTILSQVNEWDVNEFFLMYADTAEWDNPNPQEYLRRMEKVNAIISALEYDERGIEWGCLAFGVR